MNQLKNKIMPVQLHKNSRKRMGFSIAFPYDKSHVDRIKLCLGTSWNKESKTWDSAGPEVLLDMERFGIKPVWISSEARSIAEKFRDDLWAAMEARSIKIYDEEYGYQKQGTMFLANQKRAILGDDMGLGKTKQALDAAMSIGATRILILAPKTLVYNWEQEIQKWYPNLGYSVLPDHKTAKRIHRSKETMPGRAEIWSTDPEIVISNYEKIRLDDWPHGKNWDVIICDEATRLKNSKTATWKYVRNLSEKSEYLWLLTGTPLEIRLIELYNIFLLMRPSVLGDNLYRFYDQHCVVDWAGSVVGAQNLDLLRERIGYWMLRRTKGEVLNNLPPLLYNNQFIQMSTIEQKEYEQLLMEFDKFMEESQRSGSSDPLVRTLRLQQYCCTPQLFGIDRKGSKYETLLETIEDWEGQIIIFCFFEEVISLLAKWLEKDIGYNPEALISGKIDANLRVPIVNRFNEGKLGKVLLSTDAGQQGLNVTSANLVIHYSQLWNPQKRKQREARAHRIGQKDTVNVLNLLYLDTIDYGMYLLNQEREQLFNDVVEGAEEIMIRKLSPERIRRIAEGRLNARN